MCFYKLNFKKSFFSFLFIFIFLSVFIFFSVSFANNSNTDNEIHLTLDTAISLAVSKSEFVKILNLDIEKMDSLLDEMKANRWFKLNANAVIAASKADSDYPYPMHRNIYAGKLSANITQPIYTFGAISNSIEAARKAKNISEFSKDLGLRSLYFAVAQAYYAALLADENYLIAKSAYNNAVNTKAIVEKSAAVRPVKSDLIRSSADMASREILVDIAKYNRDKAYRLLKILCFIDSDNKVILTTTFTKKFNKLLTDELLVNVSNYPELKILQSQADMYELQSKAKRAGFYPKLFVSGNLSRDKFDLNRDRKFDKYSNEASVALGINITLWDGGSAFAQARQDRIEGMKVLEKYNLQMRKLTNEVIDKVDQYNTYVDTLNRLKSTIGLAEKSYDMSVSRFKTGKTTALEINDAINALTSVKQQYYNALFVLNTLVYDLEKLTGQNLK